MFAYVARQPIFNRDKNIYGYELLFRNGEQNCFPNIQPDEATSKILTDSHLSYGLDEVTGNKIAFINFHQSTLLRHFPTSLDPRTTVVEIVETVDVNKDLINACAQIHRLGYKLAIDDFDDAPYWEHLFSLVRIVKIEVDRFPQSQLVDIVKKLKAHNIELVIERVETIEQFEAHKQLGFDYFQGYFLAKPQIVKHKKLGVSKLAMLDLMSESIRPELNTKNVAQVFAKDASLSFKLLRFINNPNINKSNSITSLNHAINYMGELELKKFIALLAIANISEDGQSELLNMSLIRAKFCEFIADKLKIKANPPLGYLTGLLSFMDVLTSQPMQVLSDKLPLEQSVKSALLGEEGQLGDCLKLISGFERADWDTVTLIRNRYKMDVDELHQSYVSSLTWASKILSAQNS